MDDAEIKHELKTLHLLIDQQSQQLDQLRNTQRRQPILKAINAAIQAFKHAR